MVRRADQALSATVCSAQDPERSELFSVPEIRSSWDDLTDGVATLADWRKRRATLRAKYLDLLRDKLSLELGLVHSGDLRAPTAGCVELPPPCAGSRQPREALVVEHRRLVRVE